MPPPGWKKPPGYGGYVRTSKQGRGRSQQPRARTAGPAMLPTNLANETGVNNGSGTAQDSDAQDEEDDQPDREPQALGQQADLISSRTRHGKRPAEHLAPESEIDASEGEDSDDQEPAPDDDSTEGEDEPDLTKNTRAARQRRGVARVLFDDDPLQDSPTHTRTSATNELMYLELSVTLSKTKGHVPPAWLQLVANWMQLRCVSGAAVLERGGRQQHLHLQIVLRIRIDPLDMDALRDELKTLVGWRRGDGSGTYCSAKTFGIGQARMHA